MPAHPCPSPWPQVPGERWSEVGRISHEASRTGTILSPSAVPALFGEDVLIPFHPLAMAVSCLQAFGRQVFEIGAMVRPHPQPPAPPPLACAHPSIRLSWTALLAGQPPSNGILGLTPLPAPPSLLFWAHSRTGLGSISQAPLQIRRRGGPERGFLGFYKEANDLGSSDFLQVREL